MSEYEMERLPVTLTVADLARVLRIGRNTAYRLVKEGKIRSVHIGRQLRIPRNALQEFLDQGDTDSGHLSR